MSITATCAIMGQLAYGIMADRQALVAPSAIITERITAGWPEDGMTAMTRWAFQRPDMFTEQGKENEARNFRNKIEADCLSRIDEPVK